MEFSIYMDDLTEFDDVWLPLWINGDFLSSTNMRVSWIGIQLSCSKLPPAQHASTWNSERAQVYLILEIREWRDFDQQGFSEYQPETTYCNWILILWYHRQIYHPV